MSLVCSRKARRPQDYVGGGGKDGEGKTTGLCWVGGKDGEGHYGFGAFKAIVKSLVLILKKARKLSSSDSFPLTNIRQTGRLGGLVG